MVAAPSGEGTLPGMSNLTPVDLAITGATSLLLLICVATDLRQHRIYNAVTVPFAALGLGLNIYAQGAMGIAFSLGGLLLGLAVFFLSALLGRVLGAGDCKLLAAVGALQGPQLLLWCILYSLLAGGLFAAVIALRRGILASSFGRVWRSLYMRVFMRLPMDITESPEQTRLPYAVAIGVGTLVAVWQFRYHAPL